MIVYLRHVRIRPVVGHPELVRQVFLDRRVRHRRARLQEVGEPHGHQAPAPVVPRSRPDTVARVDRLGRVSAVAQGTASILARYRDLAAEVMVRVTSRPARISVDTGTIQGLAGGTVAGGVVVQILDANGAAVRGVPVRFTVLSGAGSVEPAQASTNIEGRAVTSWTLGGTVGRQALQGG